MIDKAEFPPMCYADWLQRYAVTRPTRIAIAAPRVALTYEQLYRSLHLVAHRLAESGVRRGETVALCMHSQSLYLVFVFALNRMGCVPVDVMRREQPGAVLDLPTGISIDRVIVEQPFKGIAPAGALDVDFTWLKSSGERSVEWTGPGLPDSGSIAHIHTTSGTTGLPKLIGLSMRQIELRTFRSDIGIFRVGHGNRTMCQFSTRTSIGFGSTLANLWLGGTMFLGWPEDAVPALVTRERISKIEGSPITYRRMLERIEASPAADFSSLKVALWGGSSLSEQMLGSIRTKICQLLINGYGSTEMALTAFGLANTSGRVGHLVPWMQAQAVDEQYNPLPAGVEGILRFHSEDMVTGYMNDAAATAEFFGDGWFYPGDIGAVTEQRLLILSGRRSEHINVSGFKFAPEIVEGAILGFAGIRDCAAFGVPDSMGGEQVWAAFVPDSDVDLAALSAHCASKLGIRAPSRLVKVANLPRNEAGKILRSELQRLASSPAGWPSGT